MFVWVCHFNWKCTFVLNKSKNTRPYQYIWFLWWNIYLFNVNKIFEVSYPNGQYMCIYYKVFMSIQFPLFFLYYENNGITGFIYLLPCWHDDGTELPVFHDLEILPLRWDVRVGTLKTFINRIVWGWKMTHSILFNRSMTRKYALLILFSAINLIVAI